MSLNHVKQRLRSTPAHARPSIKENVPLFGQVLDTTSLGSGGARRDRTDDLLNANQALSQLSYGPFGVPAVRRQTSRWLEWWAWEDLNFRPHAYQARALTN